MRNIVVINLCEKGTYNSKCKDCGGCFLFISLCCYMYLTYCSCFYLIFHFTSIFTGDEHVCFLSNKIFYFVFDLALLSTSYLIRCAEMLDKTILYLLEI